MHRNSRARILVVDDVELEAKLLQRTLADSGYSNVVHRSDLASALAEVEASGPRIVVTDLELGSSTGIELTRRIRSRDKDDYTYVIMLTAHGAEARLRAAFEAGVDDFVVKPYRREELVARVQAGERIVELETTLRARSRELETALRRIDVAAAQRALANAAKVTVAGSSDGGSLDAVLGTSSWRDVETVLAKGLSDFFQLAFTSTPPSDQIDKPFIADVSLADPGKQLELHLSVVVADASVRRLAAHLLGDDEDMEAAHALVLEVANIMMGALKTSFTSQGYSFTGGLPSESTMAKARASFDACSTRSRMGLAVDGIHVELWLRVREKKNATIRGRSLREGMVLSEDIRDANGMLLIRGGSRLTATAAERIARLQPDLEVVVADLEAA